MSKMSQKYVVFTAYWNGTGSTECFKYWLAARLYMSEKKRQGFKSTMENRFYEFED